jgi:hypothetical protein
MNSRFIRILIVVVGVAIVASAALLIRDLDSRIRFQQSSSDALREQARALGATISDVRVGQVAYVANGQSVDFWMAHVAKLLPTLQTQSAEFGAALTAPTARAAFDAALVALENFKTLDNRVREFLTRGNGLLAGDLIFADGIESATTASSHLATALQDELQLRTNSVAQIQRRQIEILGGATGGILLLLLALAFTGTASRQPAEPPVTAPVIEPIRFEAPLPRAKAAVTPKLITTAQLCGELSRITESRQLPALLERAAKVLDASGMIAWVADPSGRELRPAVSFGYPEKVVARMGGIPRDAGNAVAAAYRCAELRTVAGEGTSNGALVTPMMTPEGCIGVLSTELKSGCEKDESSQALATIFAAQLATLVSPPPVALPVKAAAQA